jgi:hypothetical protein
VAFWTRYCGTKFSLGPCQIRGHDMKSVWQWNIIQSASSLTSIPFTLHQSFTTFNLHVKWTCTLNTMSFLLIKDFVIQWSLSFRLSAKGKVVRKHILWMSLTSYLTSRLSSQFFYWPNFFKFVIFLLLKDERKTHTSHRWSSVVILSPSFWHPSIMSSLLPVTFSQHCRPLCLASGPCYPPLPWPGVISI